MGSKEIFKKVLKRVTPTEPEKKRERALAERIIKQVKEMEGKHVDVMLCGSIARDTHLRGDNDLDIFVLFPEKLERQEFEREGIRIGKRVFRGHEWEKAFSEHPYIRGIIDGFDVEIVPSYKVGSAEMLQSAVDRSPFHNQFLQSRLDGKQRQETRLLRQFLKGIRAYGADIKASSVPGYVVELLILHYGSFLDAIKAIAKWRQGQVIDLAGHWNEKEAGRVFSDAALVVVDPVDRNRNVAAALSLNQFSRIVAASQAFLRRPSEKFFFREKEGPWPVSKVRKMLQKKELVAVKLGYPKGALPDIVWGQIQRLARKIETQLKLNDFKVVRSEAWTDEKQAIVMIFEVETGTLQKSHVKLGPFVTDEGNSRAFLEAHKRVIAGPRIEQGRWLIEIPRKYVRIERFLQDFLKKEKRVEKALLKKAINKLCRVIQEKQIIDLYRKNREFAAFLSSYLRGEEEFL
ncbi:MAG: CCA tRNA nucleotidyltransferase [Candidatus Diapherotrites archaeon]|uniref:CCA-adding enzyme n=1 Tax=Candidatus Iainarchaeum sp. TaxID=3101447 RepID=A0A939C747_9ARCH|nr:CCA tRNA nucleotidyltransferase [Candidatus Diapherotrites archaeon]